MATYPSDATVAPETFPVVSSITYTSVSTGTTNFTLPSVVTSRSEVLVIVDGITQATSIYTLDGGGEGITFIQAPNPSTSLIIKNISVPTKYLLNREIEDSVGVNYGNSVTTINSNTYMINSNQESFALPAGHNVSAASEIFVYIGGVFQDTDAFTYPSVALGTEGIDIGDNTATKLLCNFNGADGTTPANNDESSSAHTLDFEKNAQLDTSYKQFGTASLLLDGTNDAVNIAASNDFDFSDDNYTLECFVRPAAGDFTANSTILSRTKDVNNFYRLALHTDSNISFSYMQGGVFSNVTGGNANGEVFSHVAVSYNHADSVLALFVNNVRVATSSLTVSNHAVMVNAPLQIGNANVLAQDFNGHIDALRMSKSLKYNSATIQPANTEPTVIGGGALGSIDKSDNLSIRTFGMTATTLDRFNSMADRKPDKGFATDETFSVATFTSQAGYEKRRLNSRRSKRSYQLTYSNITGIEKTAIQDFYKARSGSFESFTFDLSHLNDSGTLYTRFEGPLNITQTLSAGTTLLDNFYTVSFSLQEVFD